MAQGLHYISITLDGSGEGSDSLYLHGLVTAIRVERSSGSPVVTVADDVDTLLSAVTVSSDTTYHPVTATTTNDGSTAAAHSHFLVAGKVTITVTSGAAAGTVEVWIKTL